MPPSVNKLQDLNALGLLDGLAVAFGNQHDAAALLAKIGFPEAQRPYFGNYSKPVHFWADVCREVEHGRPEGGLKALLAAAADLMPHSKKFEPWSLVAPPIKLLFLAACPTSAEDLRYGREWENIRRRLARPDLAVRIETESRFAVSVEELAEAINRERPTVLHFCGHGEQDGAIVLEDDRGRPVRFPVERLARVLRAIGSVRLVYLNSCYVGEVAGALCSDVEAVIGSRFALDDDLALGFAVGFYARLSENPALSVGAAFDLVRATAGAADALLARAAPGIDLHQLSLSRPRGSRP